MLEQQEPKPEDVAFNFSHNASLDGIYYIGLNQETAKEGNDKKPPKKCVAFASDE